MSRMRILIDPQGAVRFVETHRDNAKSNWYYATPGVDPVRAALISRGMALPDYVGRVVESHVDSGKTPPDILVADATDEPYAMIILARPHIGADFNRTLDDILNAAEH